MSEKIAWTFPGGKKVVVKDTGIAGNVATITTVPAGKRWVPLNVTLTITTDATIASRYPYVAMRDIADATKFSSNGSAITASLGPLDRYFNPAFAAVSATNNALGVNIMDASEDIHISLLNGVVGDSYDYLIEYLEIDI